MFAISNRRVAAHVARLQRQCCVSGGGDSPSFFSPHKTARILSTRGVAPPTSTHVTRAMPRSFASSSSARPENSNELVVPDPAPPLPPSEAILSAALPTTRAADDVRQSEEFLARTSELAAHTADSARQTSSCDELIASADGLLALASTPAFGRAASLAATNDNEALHGLHRAFLAVADRCVGAATATATAGEEKEEGPRDHSSTGSSEGGSEIVARRALDLSRRAEELGLPLHRPMYRRLALGLVAASTAPPMASVARPISSESTGSSGGEGVLYVDGGDASTVVAPGIALELLDLCARAHLASSGSNARADLRETSTYLLEEPFVELIRRKRYGEALQLVRGMQGRFGFKWISESVTAEVLAVLKKGLEDRMTDDEHDVDDVDDEDVREDSRLADEEKNRCVMELLNIVYTSMINTASERRTMYKEMNRALAASGALLYPIDSGNEHDDEDRSFDAYGEDYGDAVDYDSDDDSDDDEDFESADMDQSSTDSTPGTASSMNESHYFRESETYDNSQGNLDGENEGLPDSIKVNLFDAKTGETKTLNKWDIESGGMEFDSLLEMESKSPPDRSPQKEGTLVEGMSDEYTRDYIYVRNKDAWEIPDLLPQLEALNGGKDVRFTHEYEKRLGLQIANEDEWNE